MRILHSHFIAAGFLAIESMPFPVLCMFYVIEGAIEAKEGAAQMSNTLGGFDHTKCTNQPGSTCGFMEAAGIPVLCGEVAGECAVPTSSH